MGHPEQTGTQTPGRLVVVATPIGNLGDITVRALEALRTADVIAAEDTRQTLRLLNHFEIRKPLVSCHDVNERDRTVQLMHRMQNGETIALVSDAGTPGISDPGEHLIRESIAAGIPVTMMPGCAAAVMAVVLSGLPTDRFCFEGFLPQQGRERRRALEALVAEERTMVFYESPHRILDTLADMRASLGDRRVALARELTKLHEEVLRGTLSEMEAWFGEHAPRGEFVMVLAGAPRGTGAERERAGWLSMSAEEHVAMYEAQGMGRMDAIKQAARDRGVGKREIYALLNGEGG